jgi:hypothetical protein
MQHYKKATDFFLNPNFTLSNQELLLNLEIPESIKSIWNMYINNVLISDEIPSRRSLYVKERYQILEPLKDKIDLIKFPLFILVLAEAIFWLDDLNECYNLLFTLLEILGKDDQLVYILTLLKELRADQIIQDELFFNNEGDDSLDGAVLHKFNSPFSLLNQNLINIDNKTDLNGAIEEWNFLKSSLNEKTVIAEFERYSCIATNELEYVFELTGESCSKLMSKGFYIDSIDGFSRTSKEKEEKTVIRILNNTYKTLTSILQVPEHNNYEFFNEKFIKNLHKTLIDTDNLEAVEMVDYDNHEYMSYRLINVGKFREKTCITTHNDETEIIQFCHHSKIDEEMSKFCHDVRILLSNNENNSNNHNCIDPFVKAAWIQWAFLRIHPFEDGNGKNFF